mgnify:FL=1
MNDHHYRLALHLLGQSTLDLPILRQGQRGPEVLTLQRRLISVGLDGGPAGADGIFGPSTDGAVRRLQQATGLPVSGVMGSDSWAQLLVLERDAGVRRTTPPTGATVTPIRFPGRPAPSPTTGELVRSGPAGGLISRIEQLPVWAKVLVGAAMAITAGGLVWAIVRAIAPAEPAVGRLLDRPPKCRPPPGRREFEDGEEVS